MRGLRCYQGTALESTAAVHGQGGSSALAVLPTGTGKTFFAAAVVEWMRTVDPRPCLFLVHREDLVFQTDAEFRARGLSSAIEMAGFHARAVHGLFDSQSDAIVGSVQSLQRARLASWPRDAFSLIIVDECHHVLSPSYAAILDHFNARRFLLGITATPDRGDKRSLGSVFARKAIDYPIVTAIRGDARTGDPGGWLVPPKVRKVMVPIDLADLKAKKGQDYNDDDLAERIGPHLESMCRALVRHVDRRSTVLFCPDVASAQAAADVLNALAGRTVAEYVAGAGGRYGMPKAEKREKLKRFDGGEFQFLSTCELYFEGYNCTRIKAIAMMRPCRLRYRWGQSVGRGLRPCPETGYDDCLVVDFDWQAGERTRDLALTVDLYDRDEFPDAVIDLARTIERDKAKQAAEQGAESVEIDPEEVIEQAEEVFRVRARLDIRLTGAEEVYKTIDLDPLGIGAVFDLKLKKRTDFDRDGSNPLSQAQGDFLVGLGVEAPGDLSFYGASKLISHLKKRRDAGQATPEQVRKLLAAGVKPEIARALHGDQARSALRDIAAAARIVPDLSAADKPKGRRRSKGKGDDTDIVIV